MNVLNLAGSLCIKVHKLLTSWGSSSLFIIGCQTRKERVGLLCDTIRFISGLGLFSGMILAVEVVQGVEEAARDSMLLIKVDSSLSSGVSDSVTMGKVFCDDTASWLLLLGYFVAITLFVGSIMVSIVFVEARRASNLDLSRAKLGVVEQKSCLGGGFLLELNGGLLCLSDRSKFEACDLSTEAEEVLNFLLASL